jgi:hypothetical protein
MRADECRRLAADAGNASDKSFWLGLVARWEAPEIQKARQPIREKPPPRRRSVLATVDDPPSSNGPTGASSPRSVGTPEFDRQMTKLAWMIASTSPPSTAFCPKASSSLDDGDWIKTLRLPQRVTRSRSGSVNGMSEVTSTADVPRRASPLRLRAICGRCASSAASRDGEIRLTIARVRDIGSLCARRWHCRRLASPSGLLG